MEPEQTNNIMPDLPPEYCHYWGQVNTNPLSGTIRIPVNCGQQLYDVIDVTDNRAGLSAEKKRGLGLTMVYDSRRGEYEEQLSLWAL